MKYFSRLEDTIIFGEKKVNWFLVFYKFIFIIFNLANLFVIFSLKSFPIFCFGIIILLSLIGIFIILFHFKKKFKYFIISYIFTLLVFLLWIILVGIDKCFNVKFPLILNISYVIANFSKLISDIIISSTLYKMKKRSNN